MERASVLDVGCDQGRDSLFIARRGHRVTAVDLSPAGIRDLTEEAAQEGLEIEGVIADIRHFEPQNSFDVIVIDRTLHMLAESDRIAVLARLTRHVEPKGFILIADERSNIGSIETVLEQSEHGWRPHHKCRGYLFVERDD